MLSLVIKGNIPTVAGYEGENAAWGQLHGASPVVG